MMSGELSDKLQLSQSNKSLSKTGQLNTPDVSMEQSKSRNNLDQQEKKEKQNPYAFMSLKPTKLQYIDQDSKKLATLQLWYTFDFFLYGLDRNIEYGESCSTQTVHKPVQQSSQKVLIAYYSNVYTVVY